MNPGASGERSPSRMATGWSARAAARCQPTSIRTCGRCTRTGDELLTLLSGAIDAVFDEPGGERVMNLRGGQTCIVPRGV